MKKTDLEKIMAAQCNTGLNEMVDELLRKGLGETA